MDQGFVFDANGNYVSGGGADAGIFNGDTQLLQPSTGAIQGGWSLGPAPEPDPTQALTPTINNQFAGYSSSLDNVMNVLDQNLGRSNEMINNNYNTSLGGLNSSFDQGTANIGRSRELVGERQAKSLRDLSSNIRNSFQQGQNQLGNLGAGDSSAVDQYSYALTKVQNQGRGDLLQQANGQYKDLDLQQNALAAQKADKINQLNTWKNNAALEIANQYATQRAQLEQMKAGANALQQQAIAQQQQAIGQQAMQQLGALDQQFGQAWSQSTGGLQGGSGVGGLDIQPQAQQADLKMGPLNTNMNFLQPGVNAGGLQGSMGSGIQGNFGTPAVKRPWEW